MMPMSTRAREARPSSIVLIGAHLLNEAYLVVPVNPSALDIVCIFATCMAPRTLLVGGGTR